MDILSSDIKHLFQIFNGHLRLVGGSVRNHLLGLPIQDFDFATPFSPEQMIALLEKNNIKTFPTGIEHGTITAVINHTPYEITTLRRDEQTDGRHATVSFVDDYAQDAKRRDFTINALYMDEHGKIYDYVNGLKDIRTHTIRFIGNAEQRVQEDYLRILRFFRFYALFGKGRPNQEALQACAAFAVCLKQIAMERKRDELFKILKAPKAIETLQLMQKHFVLQQLFSETHIPLLKQFIKLMPHATPFQKLFILTNGVGLENLKLTRQQMKDCALYQKNFSFDGNLKADRFLLWQLGKEHFTFHLNKARLNQKITPAYVQKLKRLTIPHFPITGADFVKHGITGIQIGLLLQQAETVWQELNFTQKKELVLKKLFQYNKINLKS